MVLTWLIAIPFLGGTLAWMVGRVHTAARWVALAACAAQLGLAVGLWIAYQPSIAGGSFLVGRAPWIPQLGISYHLEMDGISLLLVALTGLLGMVAVASSWREVESGAGSFHFALLLVLTGVAGVFLSRDLLLFYLFWELMLVPMYFLIALWGHERRAYAAVKFFLFTFISSLFMLAAILGLVFLHLRATGTLTFDANQLLGTPLPPAVAMWLMLGFFLAFATKLPAAPLHTWLADAHTEAPTAGSVVLAGLMLKTGAYGLLRFAVPLFPQASAAWAPVAAWLGVASILYGAFLSFAQTDFKRLVAYSSVSHMGFVMLGVYAGNALALQGAVMQILAHGLSTGALFALSGSIQERTHTRDLGRLGGLWQTAPRLSGFTLFFALGALGLPGLANFIGEFLVLIGAFLANPAWGAVGAVGFVLSVVYALRLLQESVYGPNREQWRIPDLSPREMVMLGSLAIVLLWLGLWPQTVLRTSGPALVGVSLRQERVAPHSPSLPLPPLGRSQVTQPQDRPTR